MNNIRNFSIIAHIDHGKSTLADRMLELTGTIEKRKMREQYLDMNPLEREKGITIKMQPVRMEYHAQIRNSKLEITDSEYILNLIDTPGHVDFSYEVSRALAAVEGTVLLVDATQGVQAQTVANLHLAQASEKKLVIIPVINKIDLPSAEVAKTKQELQELLKIPEEDILEISAKTGIGVDKLLEKIVEKIPAPQPLSIYRYNEPSQTSLRALIFDSIFDPYQGIIAYVRVFEGGIKKGEMIYFMASGAKGEVLEAGIFSPQRKPKDRLDVGEIGYIATGIKEPEKVRVGDTIIRYGDISKSRHSEISSGQTGTPEGPVPLPGYKEPEPMVFASVFPEDQDDYENLRESLKKLRLNDAAIFFEPEQIGATLGRGFRVGFLGMLHMEITAERLKREYDLELVFSNPSVAFRAKARNKEEEVASPMKMPDLAVLEYLSEPWVKVEIISPAKYLGALTTLLKESEGVLGDTIVLAGERLLLKCEAPLREIIVDFYDELKSISQGYASMAYEMLEYRRGDLVRLDIIIAGEKVPAFSEILPREKVHFLGRAKVQKLKQLLPPALFAIALQAETEGRIIARETIPAMRKDVTGYLYGGDRSRKMKLWKKQKRGKKKLLASARVDISPEIFLKMLKRDSSR